MTIKLDIDYGDEEWKYARWYEQSTRELNTLLREREQDAIAVKNSIQTIQLSTGTTTINYDGLLKLYKPNTDKTIKFIGVYTLEKPATKPYKRTRRGDGWTTHLMTTAPEGAFFVVLGGQGYYNYMKQDINRKDLQVVAFERPSRLAERFMGSSRPIVIDHSVWEYLLNGKTSEMDELDDLLKKHFMRTNSKAVNAIDSGITFVPKHSDLMIGREAFNDF